MRELDDAIRLILQAYDEQQPGVVIVGTKNYRHRLVETALSRIRREADAPLRAIIVDNPSTRESYKLAPERLTVSGGVHILGTTSRIPDNTTTVFADVALLEDFLPYL